jgi:hypothetical protein
MLILSFPKYSSAGATRHFGAALATVFVAPGAVEDGFALAGAAAVFAGGFDAVAGAFCAGAGGAVDGTAAVEAAATSERHAISRFTQVSSYVILICECCERRSTTALEGWRLLR